MVITLALGDTKLYFPVNPSKITYKTATFFKEYDIINKGPSKVPSGEEIATIGWESFFPGKNVQKMGILSLSSTKTPTEIHNQLESWRKSGKKLKLNITTTPFCFDVYIDSYEASAQDAYGSIYYTLEFSKAVDIVVETVAPKKKTTTAKKSTKNRSSKRNTQKKYKVRKNDCLWKIAKKFYKNGSQWKKIYKANKSTIEKAAKKHGRKSSSNGHWIYPGTVLKIP